MDGETAFLTLMAPPEPAEGSGPQFYKDMWACGCLPHSGDFPSGFHVPGLAWAGLVGHEQFATMCAGSRTRWKTTPPTSSCWWKKGRASWPRSASTASIAGLCSGRRPRGACLVEWRLGLHLRGGRGCVTCGCLGHSRADRPHERGRGRAAGIRDLRQGVTSAPTLRRPLSEVRPLSPSRTSFPLRQRALGSPQGNETVPAACRSGCIGSASCPAITPTIMTIITA